MLTARHDKGSSRRGPWRVAAAGLALAGSLALVPVVGAAAGGAAWLDVGQTPAPPAAGVEAVAAVAALGGDVGFARTRYASTLVLAGVAPVLVVSGGGWGGDDGYLMAEAASAAGLRGDRVVVEPTARDTRENVLRLAELARARGWSGLLVVTSPWHTRRARLLFARLAPGLSVRIVSVPAGGAEPPPSFGALVGEYARLFVQAAIIW